MPYDAIAARLKNTQPSQEENPQARLIQNGFNGASTRGVSDSDKQLEDAVKRRLAQAS